VFRRIIQIIIPVLIALMGVASMSLISYLLNAGWFKAWPVSRHDVVNSTFTMQVIMLLFSFLAITLIYLPNKKQFRLFFRWSDATTGKEAHEWSWFGLVIGLAFTAGTILFMSSSVTAQHGAINRSFFTLLPLVILFAATNAWSEEIFTRFVIVTGLYGKLSPVAICRVSAIVFGAPHYFGTPSGFFGVLMAGLLGWFLAKSVIDTRGMKWALLIHFLQDLVIFGAGAMVLAGKS
jgi:membrane protease YdiL (CAAX protease family)